MMRHTLRQLLKQPGYSASVIVTLALVIGANAAIFSAVDAILLRPLPITALDRLVVCWGADSARNLTVVELSHKNFEYWAANSRSLTAAAAIGASNWSKVLDGHGEPVRLPYTAVTASFFETLGARPMLGRTFRPEDDVPNAAPVIMLSHRTWVRRFSANGDVIGRAVRLGGEPHTVVGVMPPGFEFPRGAEFWMPVVPALATAGALWKTDALSNVGTLFVVGRLPAGVTPAAAAHELDQLAGRPEALAAGPRFGSSVVVTPLTEYLLGPVRTALWLLFAAAGVLLLVACANVSGLMLTRVSLRRRDHAIRLALGATRAGIARLWVLETLVLSVAGGVLGLLLSRSISAAIVALGPDDVPRLGDVAVGPAAAAFTFVVVLTTAVLCGFAPIRWASASNLVDAISDAARTTTGRQSRRARSLLLSVQIALAVVLLVSAGLVIRSFGRLQEIDLGFNPARVLTMNIAPRGAEPSPKEWFEELLIQVAAIPGVEAAGTVSLPPLALGAIGQETWVRLEGQADNPESRRRNPMLNYQVASPGYFIAMQIAVKQGRLFDARDDHRSPRVAIVGESTARRLWPGENAIGKRLAMPTFRPGDTQDAWRTVVGVVSDVRYRGINDVRLNFYEPMLQARETPQNLVVRTTGSPLDLVAAVQARARNLDPRVVIDKVTTMDAVVSRALAAWRLSAWMLTLFAALAFLLAAVGLFSVVTLDVASRRHEFAVRLALGAAPRDILQVVSAGAGKSVAAGAVLGLVGAIGGTRLLRGLLYEVHMLDTATYASVLALVVGVVGLATYLPARRAASIDPMTLLRRE